MKLRPESPRSWGFVAGVALALAGPFGAAVGLYSLPDPRGASVTARTYVRAGQSAIAVLNADLDHGWAEVRVRAAREAWEYSEAHVARHSRYAFVDPNAGTSYAVSLERCFPGPRGWRCNTRHWQGEIFARQFAFDPLMRSASLRVRLDGGCSLRVDWDGQGIVAPFANHFHDGNASYDGSNAFLAGFAELSRVAPARVTMCGIGTHAAPGYLSTGSNPFMVDVRAITSRG